MDWVTEAGLTAGRSAARLVQQGTVQSDPVIPLIAGENVRYVVTHTLHPNHLAEDAIRVQMRVSKPIEAPCG